MSATRGPLIGEAAAPARVLLVDDDADLLDLLGCWLREDGFEVCTAANGRDALRSIDSFAPSLLLTDMVMDELDGLRLISAVHGIDPVLPVVMMSAHAKLPDAVNAAQLGVSAFLGKPIDRSELRETVDRFAAPSSTPASRDSFAPEILHRSAIMRALLDRARLVSAVDSTVLITGNTGTGKELLARAIHDAGPRANGPFTTVNCSALPEHLLESELFGHERGAFTGAQRAHEGLFRASDTGTLFLDEIGDLPLPMQAKLLRVLQELKVRPLGSTKYYPVDVRIVAATHVDLEKAVRDGRFREDLYYRVSVVPLHMPDLSERREDIGAIVDGLLVRLALRYGRERQRFAPEALTKLAMAPWPGNVRQLANTVEQCWVLSPGSLIPAELVDAALDDQQAAPLTLEQARQQFEHRYLVSVLRLAGGKVHAAAKLAGRNRTEFYRLLARHSIDPRSFREAGDAAQGGETTEDE